MIGRWLASGGTDEAASVWQGRVAVSKAARFLGIRLPDQWIGSVLWTDANSGHETKISHSAVISMLASIDAGRFVCLTAARLDQT